MVFDSYYPKIYNVGSLGALGRAQLVTQKFGTYFRYYLRNDCSYHHSGFKAQVKVCPNSETVGTLRNTTASFRVSRYKTSRFNRYS